MVGGIDIERDLNAHEFNALQRSSVRNTSHDSVATVVGDWFVVSAAVSLLTILCCYNAIQSPAFDSFRSVAYLLRTRRGPYLPLVRLEGTADSATYVHRLIHSAPKT